MFLEEARSTDRERIGLVTGDTCTTDEIEARDRSNWVGVVPLTGVLWRGRTNWRIVVTWSRLAGLEL